MHGVGPALFVLCAVSSVGDTFYWTTYHAYFASLGDAEHRGHQVGAREALAAVVGIIGPLATGWALTALGPRAAFGATAVVLVLAALPLVWTPRVAVLRTAPGAFKASLPGALLFAADGWSAAGFVFVWQIALFLALGESFSAFGGAMALAAMVGALGGLVLGRLIDAGHGARAALIAFLAASAGAILRAASYDNATFAVVANAGGALVACVYIPAFGTAVYNQAKRSPCALRFHIAAEAGWDLGGATALLATAGLLLAGVPIAAGILLCLPGLVASFLLMRRYYGEPLHAAPNAAALPAAAPDTASVNRTRG